jgi:hypothetical protein
VRLAGTLAIAFYVFADMEYPRLGLIRIGSFDDFLAEAYAQMRPVPAEDMRDQWCVVDLT